MRKGAEFWRKQIALAKAARKHQESWWEANLKAYAPSATLSPEQYGQDINTGRDFTLVERKKSDLFFQRPDVTLQPTPLLDIPLPTGQVDPATMQPVQIPQADLLQAHQEIINEKLGSDGIDATAMMDQALLDVELFGLGATKMGYESVTVDVDQPDPAWQPDPVMEALGQPQEPPMIRVPVPIHQHCFWHHFSLKQLLIPHDARSTEFDRGPWVGFSFTLPLTAGNRQKYKLSEEFQGSKTDAKSQRFDHGATVEPGEEVFTGVEIYYRSALYRDDVLHPDHLTQLVLVDGEDKPVIEQDCPYQTLDEKGGLTPDSLVGFPIHIFSTRVLTDSAYPPSDCAVSRPLVNELNRSREQNLEFRDAATMKWQYNVDTLPRESLDKIVRAPIGGMIGVPSEAFTGEGAIKELPHGSMPRENFAIQDYIDGDIARVWALDAQQLGVQSDSGRTATADQIQQANANARLDKERGVILKQYLRGVTKFSTIQQRYLPVEQAAKIVGPQRAQLWDSWRKSVPSELAFTAMPDSALRVDQAVDRKQAQDLYTYLANDPHVNRQELLRSLLRKFHLDPAKIMVQPPPPKPEPPKLALSFKGEDLVSPQAPIVLEILQQLGVQVSAEAVSLSQGMLLQAQQLAAAEAAEAERGTEGNTKHGGKVAQAEGLDKHAVDQTGGMQGTGAPAMMGAAGGMLQ